ncbi:hypothetical protein [Rhodococcus koreensis]|uniref:hypothetical protein n=1 Tax=Rhodococcus koreensis TaxID=99653 RepID=UPI0036DB7A8E
MTPDDPLHALRRALDTGDTEHLDEAANTRHQAARNPRTGKPIDPSTRRQRPTPHYPHESRLRMFVPPELDPAARMRWIDTIRQLAQIPTPTRADTVFAGLDERMPHDDD